MTRQRKRNIVYWTIIIIGGVAFIVLLWGSFWICGQFAGYDPVGLDGSFQ